MYAYLMLFLVGVLAIGRHESVAGMVENIQKTLMERQSSPEDGGENHIVGRYVYL